MKQMKRYLISIGLMFGMAGTLYAGYMQVVRQVKTISKVEAQDLTCPAAETDHFIKILSHTRDFPPPNVDVDSQLAVFSSGEYATASLSRITRFTVDNKIKWSLGPSNFKENFSTSLGTMNPVTIKLLSEGESLIALIGLLDLQQNSYFAIYQFSSLGVIEKFHILKHDFADNVYLDFLDNKTVIKKLSDDGYVILQEFANENASTPFMDKSSSFFTITKVDNNFQFLWSKKTSLPGNLQSLPNSQYVNIVPLNNGFLLLRAWNGILQLDNNGNILGYYLNPNPNPPLAFNFGSGIETTDGIILAGILADRRPILLKLDGLGGSRLWHYAIDNSGFSTSSNVPPIFDIIPLDNGHYIFTGIHNGGSAESAQFLLEFDSNGNFIWSKQIKNAGWEGYDIAEGLNGDLLAVAPHNNSGFIRFSKQDNLNPACLNNVLSDFIGTTNTYTALNPFLGYGFPSAANVENFQSFSLSEVVVNPEEFFVSGDFTDLVAFCPSCPHCGDNLIDVGNGEQCDDGNTIAGDGCSATCTIENLEILFQNAYPDVSSRCFIPN